MNVFDAYMANKPVFDTLYALIIIVCCFFIARKGHYLYSLSNYKGFRYFRNAYLSFGAAFIVWLPLQYLDFFNQMNNLSDNLLLYFVLFLGFGYFISMAGFYLVYSLVWKQCSGKEQFLHIIALVIAVLDFYFIVIAQSFSNQHFMFVTQLVVIGYAIHLSYGNYKVAEKKDFRQLYVVCMVMSFIGYFSNYLIGFIIPYLPSIIMYVKIITLLVFFIFLYGVLMYGQKKRTT